MNSIRFSKILRAIRQQIVCDKFKLRNITGMNADQDLLITRIRLMFQNIEYSFQHRDCCDLCREEFEDEKYHILSMIDDYLAGKLKNVSLTLPVNYKSKNDNSGFGVFIYQKDGKINVQFFDDDIKSLILRNITNMTPHEIVNNSNVLLIDGYELVNIDGHYMYESEILSIIGI